MNIAAQPQQNLRHTVFVAVIGAALLASAALSTAEVQQRGADGGFTWLEAPARFLLNP